MKSFKQYINEASKVDAIVQKLKGISKVQDLVMKYATDINALAVVLLSIPLVNKLVFGATGDKLNNARLIAQGLSKVVLGEDSLSEEYITEKPAKLSASFPYKGAEWKDFRGLENPNEREIRALMKKTKFKELRFLVDTKGKMWAWDTENALHDEVVFAMTGQKYVGDYAKGMVNFINPDDEDDYMAVPDGNLHVTVLNTRTVGDDFALKNRTMKALAKRINSKGKDRVYWNIG